jgi:drug/metabolite transporter (DMT)-like permease
VIVAFVAIYVFWGATFLAIRIAVLEIPPLFTAGLRFFIAGTCLYVFMRVRGEARPSLIEWRNLAFVATCMFVLTYGPLFWAEQYVSSSATAVIQATLPLTIIAFEVFVFRRLALRPRLASGVLFGFGGVALLVIRNTEQHLAIIPCLAILGGGLAWSFGTVISSRLALPRSRVMTAGSEMLLGGVALLMLSAACGEMHPLPHMTLRAALALGYLIVFGSVIAYTAYVWLLGRLPATQVASHAYVNPIVAVALGYFLAGESVTPRMLLATALVTGSVFLILSRRTSVG